MLLALDKLSLRQKFPANTDMRPIPGKFLNCFAGIDSTLITMLSYRK